MTSVEQLQLGFGMSGLEADVAGIVENVCAAFERPTYLEIGVGHGKTLATIASLLSVQCQDWRAIGIELQNGYSFDKGITKQNAVDRGISLDFCNGVPEGKIIPPWNRIIVILENSQVVLAAHWIVPIHLALIDGCHGRPCASLDFLCVEPFIVPGGIVMFHDFGTDQIGQSQPHCPTVDVRGACQDLGLMDGTRKGWRFVSELFGDKGREGANMGVFKKHGLGNSDY